MSLSKKKLITIICESALESFLIEDIKELGAKGYTIVDAKGEGHRGMRQGDWEQNRNIRLEVVCGEDRAYKIVEHLRANYYENYAMIVYLTDVEVLRTEKF